MNNRQKPISPSVKRPKARPVVGISQWFQPGHQDQVEAAITDLRALGIKELRTLISWAEWETGSFWTDWLFRKLSSHVNILPCFTLTPPSKALIPKKSSPPGSIDDYAHFIETMIKRYGSFFDWIELWHRPDDLQYWDWNLDPDWKLFGQMVSQGSAVARTHGKKSVLAGLCPTRIPWLEQMAKRGVLDSLDAIGLHTYPGTWEFSTEELPYKVEEVRDVLERYNLKPEIWLTEVGYSTWKHEEKNQLNTLYEALKAPVERVYWSSLYDLKPKQDQDDEFPHDERDWHLGLKDAVNTPKLLYRIWEQKGLKGVVNAKHWMKPRHRPDREQPVLITGGAGFIGTNLAAHLAEQGKSVLIYDNLSHPGSEKNLRELLKKYGERIQAEIADIRHQERLQAAVARAKQIYHLAAQSSMTVSLTQPRLDFEVNTLGTLNILEAIRSLDQGRPLVFTSIDTVTPKLPLLEKEETYEPVDARTNVFGIAESEGIENFHTPHGCSKGCAEQYILDYTRQYGMEATVLRLGCVVGPHQLADGDHGWIAHALLNALTNEPITIYGDGKQVQDILYVADLVIALELAMENMESLTGKVFHVGGGPDNALSLMQLVDLFEDIHGEPALMTFDSWRPTDRRYAVSDSRRFQDLTGWKPLVPAGDGIARLYAWLKETAVTKNLMFPSLPPPDFYEITSYPTTGLEL